MVKTRFAPSPTGYLHLGNLRTALFNALAAFKAEGHFVLRVEDTDRTRSEERYTHALIEDLAWAGLVWQEGPDNGGPAAPYRQSGRAAIYRQHLDHLRAGGRSYPCFCTTEQLAAQRAAQRASGKPPRYPGTCARLGVTESEARLAQGQGAAWRFRVPAGRPIVFVDRVRGEQHFTSDDIGDFVIQRQDGTAAFFFSNAVDDALMGITLVLRGDDHLTNTPRQLMILEALELPAPQYGHLSMITDADGAPLSKRSGSFSLAGLRARGYRAEAVVNYLARLGHAMTDERLLPIAELAAVFDPARISTAPAHYDAVHLEHWQRRAVSNLDDAGLAAWIEPAIRAWVPAEQRVDFAHLVRDNMLYPQDAARWARVLFDDVLDPEPDATELLATVPGEFFHAAHSTLNHAHGLNYSDWVAAITETTGRRGRSLYMPLRAALTGTLHGPELAGIFRFMPHARLQQRLIQAQTH